MNGFRVGSLWVVGLVWLAMGVRCADTVNSDAKPSKVASAEVSGNPIEIVTTDKPLVDELGSTVIPLNKIWGHMIAETQSIHLLEQEFSGPTARKNPEQESPLFLQIVMALKRRIKENQAIGSGFVVAGTGREALDAAKKIMEQDQIPLQIFPSGTEVSLFFFTYDLGMSFQLKEIRQSKEAVTIQYRFSTNGTERIYVAMSTYYFALIPLGKPATGNIVVKMVELPVKKKHGRNVRPYYEQRAEKRISKSFAFTIESITADASNNE